MTEAGPKAEFVCFSKLLLGVNCAFSLLQNAFSVQTCLAADLCTVVGRILGPGPWMTEAGLLLLLAFAGRKSWCKMPFQCKPNLAPFWDPAPA